MHHLFFKTFYMKSCMKFDQLNSSSWDFEIYSLHLVFAAKKATFSNQVMDIEDLVGMGKKHK